MGKGSSGTNTVETNSAPPAQVLSNHTRASNVAQEAASQPYQPYTGQIVAPFSDLQQAAFAGAYAPENAFAGAAPYAADAYQGATGALQSSTGLSGNLYQSAANQFASAQDPLNAAAGIAGNTFQNSSNEYQNAGN